MTTLKSLINKQGGYVVFLVLREYSFIRDFKVQGLIQCALCHIQEILKPFIQYLQYPLHSSSKLCKIMLDYRLSELWLSQDLTHERCQLYLIALQWFEKYSVEEFLFFKNLN